MLLGSVVVVTCSILPFKTRSQAQKPAHKDLKPKWPKPQPFRLEATYAPVSKRACSRSA
ncbi:alpha-galactosidase [Lacticaseibacillus paracasei]|nr:alpha-galactosidase [Lacticaseibacillus paracasei]QPC24083.1 alpha-galactosidase [Lacticaseibacillus paracasei subsp. tolerans]MCP9346672.1 alpha-galactosidase [Lacticaseibacillus paracasei]MCP9366268.1 alpha-galactosidase [Lacticaseibacillus paracasei]MCP9378640.1 alpha-galactosidase [Lacticaseibacillus paracasei]